MIIQFNQENMDPRLKKEKTQLCKVLFGYLEEGSVITWQSYYIPLDKSRKLLQETTKERREYYESTSYTGFYPCNLKYAIEY